MNKTEQVEQTLEEKVRGILEPLGLTVAYVHDDEVSVCNRLHQFWITNTHIRWSSEEKTVEEYHDFDGYYRDEFEQVAALLTEQPEQTLEEAVRGIVSDTDLIVSYVHDNEVSLDSGMAQHYYVSANSVKTPGTTMTLDDYVISDGKYSAEFQAIAALLSTRSTKPSYSELEQRVEELEKYKSAAKEWRLKYEEVAEASRDRADVILQLERENASILDKFGPIDQAEQQVAEVETRFQKLAKKAERIADLLIQLNEEIL